jgi:hypothetical protein
MSLQHQVPKPIDQVATNPFLDMQLNIEETLDPSKIPVYPWPLFFC